MDFDGNLIQIAAQLILAYRGYALVSLVLLVVAYCSQNAFAGGGPDVYFERQDGMPSEGAGCQGAILKAP